VGFQQQQRIPSEVYCHATFSAAAFCTVRVDLDQETAWPAIRAVFLSLIAVHQSHEIPT